MTTHSASVLLVSPSDKFYKSMIKLLPETSYSPLFFAEDACGARRVMLEHCIDLVVINAPLTDDLGTRLASDICSESSAGVLMFTKSEYFSEVFAKLAPMGVFVIPKPTSAQIISSAMLTLFGVHERFRKSEKKAASVGEKMKEIQTVNRAKMLLIEHKGMTEPQAHRFIEKQAMDSCISKRTVAEEIIRTYLGDG